MQYKTVVNPPNTMQHSGKNCSKCNTKILEALLQNKNTSNSPTKYNTVQDINGIILASTIQYNIVFSGFDKDLLVKI